MAEKKLATLSAVFNCSTVWTIIKISLQQKLNWAILG